jgi:hypothetical protein
VRPCRRHVREQPLDRLSDGFQLFMKGANRNPRRPLLRRPGTSCRTRSTCDPTVFQMMSTRPSRLLIRARASEPPRRGSGSMLCTIIIRIHPRPGIVRSPGNVIAPHEHAIGPRGNSLFSSMRMGRLLQLVRRCRHYADESGYFKTDAVLVHAAMDRYKTHGLSQYFRRRHKGHCSLHRAREEGTRSGFAPQCPGRP